MSQYTPGPWIIWSDTNGRLQVGPSTNYSVAEMWLTPLEGQEANARLIAAAPELLDALKAAVAMIDALNSAYGSEEVDKVSRQGYIAIAKATGEKT